MNVVELFTYVSAQNRKNILVSAYEILEGNFPIRIIIYVRFLGARRYLLNEKDENLPRARRNYKRSFIIIYFEILFYSEILMSQNCLLQISDSIRHITHWSLCGTHYYFT